jgi:hypothetical protein
MSGRDIPDTSASRNAATVLFTVLMIAISGGVTAALIGAAAG